MRIGVVGARMPAAIATASSPLPEADRFEGDDRALLGIVLGVVTSGCSRRPH